MGDTLYPDAVVTVMDASAAALVANLYETDRDLEDLIGTLAGALPDLVPLPDRYFHTSPGGDTYLEETVRLDIQRMIRVMDMAGLLAWQGGDRTPGRYGLGEVWRHGVVSITPFGEWMVQGYLVDTGLVSAPMVAPLTITLDDPAEEIVIGLAGYVAAGPAALAEAWARLGGWEGLPEQLWRVDRPETAPLLEALGAALTDPRAAKAARKALLKHRSWMAGRP